MTYPYISRSVTPVVSTAAYAASDVVGSLITFHSMPKGMFIQGATITAKSNQTAQFDVLVLGSSMPNTTFTDNSALAISSQDSSNVLGVIHVTDWSSLGTPSIGQANGLGYGIVISQSPMYCALVTRGTPTLGSTNDLVLTLTLVS